MSALAYSKLKYILRSWCNLRWEPPAHNTIVTHLRSVLHDASDKERVKVKKKVIA